MYQPVEPAVTMPGLTAGAVYTVSVIDVNTIQLSGADPDAEPDHPANVAGDGRPSTTPTPSPTIRP